MKKNPTYICELPPPYGGVTVKNQLILNRLKELGIEIDVIDLCECKRGLLKCIITLYRLLLAYLCGGKCIYGFGSYKRLKLALFLQKIFGGKENLSNTINIVMGGSLPQYISTDQLFSKLLKLVNYSLVETEGMKKHLENNGIRNVIVFPNPKSEKGSCAPIDNANETIKLVFFSQINESKGIREIIGLTKELVQKGIDFSIDFYGPIAPSFRDEFMNYIELNGRVTYNGVFDSTSGSVYSELNKFDILLFPSRWEGEGVPGILIESKMSGLAVIASDYAYNSELIRECNGEGFLVYKNYVSEMSDIIQRLYYDRKLLYYVKRNSYNSRKRYSLERYNDLLLRIVE